MPEATLVDDHVLVGEPVPDFFGAVNTSAAGKLVYARGDIATLDLAGAARVRAIEGSTNVGDHEVVSLGRVPLRIGGGVYYRRLFDEALFDAIRAEHTFQSLTESSKPSKAHRTGLYLTPVVREPDGLHFRLLRCSTNLAGPTENFCATDHRIVDALNREAALIFRDHAPLDHVLAQIYAATPEGTKAKISAHADKTKDMPANGIMAFCTFYDGLGKLEPQGDFDYGYKGKTGLTKLTFRPKDPALGLGEFSLTLYPGSVFFMPLSTNRLYTHEIQASMLNADMLPTRLGYVVRCSKTEAVHKDGATFLRLGDQLVPLEPPTEEGRTELRALYAEENRSCGVIDYGDRFRFSLNQGDYLAPDEKRG